MHFKKLILALVTALTATFAFAGSSAAEALLTVAGIGDSPVEIDRAEFEDMEAKTFTTTTIWTEGDITFTGVPLAALLDELGVDDGVLLASAVNDYSIEFPVEEARKDGPIVAYLMNGEPMSVRDKGPLWIVFPYDSDPAFQSEVVYSRSIWQLVRIEVAE